MPSESRQALRSRIRSINNTRKITKAMEMIANAKLVRQRNKMEANREYTSILQSTVNEIVAENPYVESKYLIKNTSPHTVTIVFCSDLGLCGAYNGNILKKAMEKLSTDDPVIVIGTSQYHAFEENGFHILNDIPVSCDQMDFQQLKRFVNMAVEKYLNGEAGKVQLLYTRFVNTMTFQPEMNQLLPCVINGEKKKQEGEHQETLFEPNAEAILDELIPMMIQDTAYSCWMESSTSEQGSRRVAMKTASDNADDLTDKLQLAYNKVRQAAITQEITEIVSGSNAV